jgi:hypothetical protein
MAAPSVGSSVHFEKLMNDSPIASPTMMLVGLPKARGHAASDLTEHFTRLTRLRHVLDMIGSTAHRVTEACNILSEGINQCRSHVRVLPKGEYVVRTIR